MPVGQSASLDYAKNFPLLRPAGNPPFTTMYVYKSKSLPPGGEEIPEREGNTSPFMPLGQQLRVNEEDLENSQQRNFENTSDSPSEELCQRSEYRRSRDRARITGLLQGNTQCDKRPRGTVERANSADNRFQGQHGVNFQACRRSDKYSHDRSQQNERPRENDQRDSRSQDRSRGDRRSQDHRWSERRYSRERGQRNRYSRDRSRGDRRSHDRNLDDRRSHDGSRGDRRESNHSHRDRRLQDRGQRNDRLRDRGQRNDRLRDRGQRDRRSQNRRWAEISYSRDRGQRDDRLRHWTWDDRRSRNRDQGNGRLRDRPIKDRSRAGRWVAARERGRRLDDNKRLCEALATILRTIGAKKN